MRRPPTITLVFGQGMRVFFLAAGIYSVLAMVVWVGWLSAETLGDGAPALPFAPPPVHWHAHEMIFGYACAVLAGFFLTAVPSWTGAPSARTTYLSALAAVWLAGRLAVWWSGGLAPALVAMLDLAFLPLLAAKLALQLVRRPKPQNLMFLVLIGLVWSGNLVVHLDWVGVLPGGAGRGLRAGLLGIAAMIAIIGGRVIPAFTRNAMLRAGRETGLPASRRPAELAGIGGAILLPVCVLLDLPAVALAPIALIAGLAQALRLGGWQSAWTLDQPILWSLHLGFAMLAAGYIALAAAGAGLLGEIAALHLLGIGAVGGMTMAMMTRAALGHTGRPLVAPRPITLAYALIGLAAATRVLGVELIPGWNDYTILTSGALWLGAYGMFLMVYWPILTSPRQSEGN